MIACFAHGTPSFEAQNSKGEARTCLLVLENRCDELLHFGEGTRLRNRLVDPETWISTSLVQLSSMFYPQWFQAYKVSSQRDWRDLHHGSDSFPQRPSSKSSVTRVFTEPKGPIIRRRNQPN